MIRRWWFWLIPLITVEAFHWTGITPVPLHPERLQKEIRHVVAGSVHDPCGTSRLLSNLLIPSHTLCFTDSWEEQSQDETTTTMIHLPRLLESLKTQPLISPIPRFHAYSYYHYSRYQSSGLSQSLSYAQYCLLEEKMASIVFAYLGDTRHHWKLMMNPFFLYQDGLKSYGRSSELAHTLWLTPSVDMGGDAVLWEGIDTKRSSI